MERKAKKNEIGLRKKDPPTDRQAAWTIERKKERKKTNEQTKEEMKEKKTNVKFRRRKVVIKQWGGNSVSAQHKRETKFDKMKPILMI